MMRPTAGFSLLHFWNIVQATAISISCLLVAIVLFFYPDLAAEYLSKISVRSAAELSEHWFELLGDVALIWAIGIILIIFDALSRRNRGASLLRTLFFDRPGDMSWQERGLMRATFWASLVLAPALIVINFGRHSLGTNWITAEDGPLEYATAINFLFSGSLLSYLAWRQVARKRPRDHRNAAMLFAISLMMLFVGFEEISWAQRILGFETPDSLKSINIQGEFNVHNIVTRELLQSYIYIASALFAVSCLSCTVMLTNYNMSRFKWFLVYLPDPSLIIMLSMIVIVSSHVQLNDLVEQLAGFVVLFYGVRLALHGFGPDRWDQTEASPPGASRVPAPKLPDGEVRERLKAHRAEAPDRALEGAISAPPPGSTR